MKRLETAGVRGRHCLCDILVLFGDNMNNARGAIW